MATAVVVINEEHSLMAQQVELLAGKFDSFTELKVPKEGWNKAEIIAQAKKLASLEIEAVVIVSPIPFLLGMISSARKDHGGTYVFHNDKRVKKEVPKEGGGTKTISTTSPEGWELLDVYETDLS